jgi:ubiquinol oxidase
LKSKRKSNLILTMLKLLYLSVLLVAPSASGFSSTMLQQRLFGLSSSSSRRSIGNTRRFVSQNPNLPNFNPKTDNASEEECGVDTPSSVFGKPLDDATKRRNRDFIHVIKGFLFDNFFDGKTVERSFARFYALETIARMPYFSYLSVLHLYETLGLWRKADYLKVHFAESWNELHHLLIMEELGGNDQWKDRFVAQHSAFFYYWMIVALYLLNPTHAYNLNQAVEQEAYDTYNSFLETHAEYLQGEPAKVAVKYYTNEDMYLFDAMHFDSSTGSTAEPGAKAEPPRRPNIQTLYDVFRAVRDDEYEHVKTMAHLQERSIACE